MRELSRNELLAVVGGSDNPPPPQDDKNSDLPQQEQQADDGLDRFADFVGNIVNGTCSMGVSKLGGVVVCAAIGEAVAGAIKMAGDIDSEQHPLPRFPAH